MLLENFYFKSAPSMDFIIHIGGPKAEVESILAKFCANEGACFSVTDQTFIYSGGREAGVAVRIINYPRFTKEYLELKEFSDRVAQHLIVELGQGSCCVVGPTDTVWITRRPEDSK